MQKIKETIHKNAVTFETSCHSLTLPFGPGWGTPNVFFDGNKIPSARIWALIANSMMKNERVDRQALMKEGQRADIYRLESGSKLVWTQNPRSDDQLLEGNMYVRKELQRHRELVKDFGVVLVKIEADPPVRDQVLEAVKVLDGLGFKPFAWQQSRGYFCKDPEAVYEAFGTRDHLRLAVYMKRPSAAPLEVNLVENTKEEKRIS